MSGDASTGDGTLDVSVVCGRKRKTQIARLRQLFPQRVTAPMYLDYQDPGMAFLCVQNPTGGVFPGDSLVTKVDVGTGARLHLTSQSATQLYAGDGVATHEYYFGIADGSLVEHFPKVAIPHAGSSFQQSNTIEVNGDSVYIGSESVASGRIGHGERFRYDLYKSHTSIAIDGLVRAVDTVRLEPASRPIGPGVLASHDYYSNFVVIAPQRDLKPLKAEFVSILRNTSDVVGAASMLPDAIGLTARFLSARAPTTQAITRELWNAARRLVLGRIPLPNRM